MTSENVEEYLERIYRLKERGDPATTTNISKEMGISPASVSEMLSKLDERGYVKRVPYKGVTLTRKGSRIGKRILRKHRTIERFLRSIGVHRRVHEQACRLEHAISDDFEKALNRRVGIGKNSKGIVPISELPEGKKAKIVSIESGYRAKRRLEEMGLTPGTEVKTGRKCPMGGPVEVFVRDSSLVIGRGLAKKIMVEI